MRNLTANGDNENSVSKIIGLILTLPRAPQDLLAFMPAAGQLFAGIGTLISGGGLSNTVASLGGKWGHESAANQNLRFDYYGEIDHGCGWCLLHDIPHNGIYNAYDTLQEYLEK